MKTPLPSWVPVVATCAVFLVLGFALKAQCAISAERPWDGRQYARLCYNDLQPLYGIRLIEKDVFPYVGGSLTGGELVNGAIEYPVLTGVFMWFSGIFSTDSNSFLVISSVLLAPFALATAYYLERMSGRRALLWAAAPALILYAFHNWDLLVVAAATAGLWQWYRGKHIGAAALFGVGAALKMYPIFFVAPLALERLFLGDKRDAAKTFGAGVGMLAAINLPFALRNFDGWFATYEFHRLRGPNYDNIWTWPPSFLPDLTPALINVVTAVLTLAFGVAALAYGWRRARTEGRYPFLPVAASLLAVFLLWNKVHSPQYALWILPFFVLLRVNIGWWVAYAVVDLMVYVGVFRFFFDQSSDFYRRLMVTGVWARAALLLALAGVFVRSQQRLEPPGPEPAGVREPRPHEPAPVGARASA